MRSTQRRNAERARTKNEIRALNFAILALQRRGRTWKIYLLYTKYASSGAFVPSRNLVFFDRERGRKGGGGKSRELAGRNYIVVRATDRELPRIPAGCLLAANARAPL